MSSHNYHRINRPIVVRGGGDLATGTIFLLSKAGYPVIATECGNPSAIRREAAFSEAVRFGRKTVEDVTCVLAENAEEAVRLAAPSHPVMLCDENLECLPVIGPQVLIDAVMAKRNIGTAIHMADLTIALGPGFTAGKDVHYVIETMRGHNLGRVIREGSALPNTGIPGTIRGYGRERVIHAPGSGVVRGIRRIGDIVDKDEVIAEIVSGGGALPVTSKLSGVLRGILPDGFAVTEGMKMADVDPRQSEKDNCFSVSDKARCIAGSVLMLVCAYDRDNLS